MAENIEVDKEYFDQRNYSFAKFTQGRRSQAVGVLLSINNNIYEWFLGNNERIFTKHGKIIKTENLERNFVIQDTRSVLPPNKSGNYKVVAALSDPDAFTSIAYDWTFKKEEEITLINSYVTKKYSEKFNAEGLYWRNFFWRKENTYWVDANTSKGNNVTSAYTPLFQTNKNRVLLQIIKLYFKL